MSQKRWLSVSALVGILTYGLFGCGESSPSQQQSGKQVVPVTTAGPIEVALSVGQKRIMMRSDGDLSARFTNTTKDRLVIPDPDPVLQYLDFRDSQGAEAPYRAARIASLLPPTVESFLVLAPGETVERSCKLFWLTDKTIRQHVIKDLGLKAEEAAAAEFVDQIMNYTCVFPGRYHVRFFCAPSSVPDRELKLGGEWVSVEKHFGATLYTGELASNTVEIEFWAPAAAGTEPGP